MFLQDLRAAISPTMTLFFEGLVAIRQQAPAIAAIGILGTPAMFQDREAEIGIFANRVARPAARHFQRSAANETHRSVNDDGVIFIPLHHTDIEEPGIFAVHR